MFRVCWYLTYNYYSVRLAELSRTVLSSTAVQISVDIGLNDHWTDLVCGVHDTQVNETATTLRAIYQLSHTGQKEEP